ncbi:MAG TPA: hypothetical protein VK503_09615 [Candidatus Bathyarchaeia archaeon]|nr:hypothetical protein [Candidatus Bathyarchaeia archaeon]
MSGDSRRSFAVAFAAFAIGATVAAVLGNSKTRDKIAEHGKKLLKNADK